MKCLRKKKQQSFKVQIKDKIPKTDLLKNNQSYGAKGQVILINFRYEWLNRDSKYLNLLGAESKIFLSLCIKTNALFL